MNTDKTTPTLLIADDNSGVRRVLVQMLATAGIQTVTAEDGEQALDSARRFRPDLIILDVGMPGRNGFEVCNELREDAATRAIPILMLTGHGTYETEYAGIGCGADAYMYKPFAFNELLTRVRGLLEERAS